MSLDYICYGKSWFVQQIIFILCAISFHSPFLSGKSATGWLDCLIHGLRRQLTLVLLFKECVNHPIMENFPLLRHLSFYEQKLLTYTIKLLRKPKSGFKIRKWVQVQWQSWLVGPLTLPRLGLNKSVLLLLLLVLLYIFVTNVHTELVLVLFTYSAATVSFFLLLVKSVFYVVYPDISSPWYYLVICVFYFYSSWV